MKKYAIGFAFLFLSYTSAMAQAFIIPTGGNNDATALSCQCYQLTDAFTFQQGTIWNQNQIDLNNPFDFTFNIFPGSRNGSGADGIVFVIQDQNQQVPASTGGGMGYLNFPGKSIGIEYDTHNNGPSNDDIPQHHIAIDGLGVLNPALAGPVPALASGNNIDDGAWHTTEIVWAPSTQTMTIYFDGNLRLTYTFSTGLVNTLFAGQNMLYWGWTGSTGSLFNVQQVCVTFQSGFDAGNNYTHCGLDTVGFQSTSTSGLHNIVAYNWNFGDGDTSGQQNPSHTYASPGVYNVTLAITDQSLCIDTQIHQVSIFNFPVLTPSQTNVSCFGDGNGIARVTVNGTAPYSYQWSPAVSTIDSATTLPPGNYSVVVTDSNGCSGSTSYVITQPPVLADSLNQVDELCNGGSTGSINNFVSGGTPGYTYAWTPNVSSGSSANNLPTGTYHVTVADANGCTISQSATITQPAPLTASASSTNVLCFGNQTGSVTITAAGGTPGYSYTWNPSVSSTGLANNIGAGIYNETVTDANGCTVTLSETITQPASPISTNATATPVLCFNQTTGTIDVTATGGTPGYNFSASDGGAPLNAPGGQFNNLGPGTYTVIVTDQNLCGDTTIAIVSSPPQLLDSLGSASPTCYHYRNGEVVIAGSGGTPGYTYTFSNTSTNSTGIFNALGAGTYVVTVTDNSGCTITDSTILTQPDSVMIEVTPDPVQVKLGQSLQINSSTNQTGTVTYTWSPDFGLSCYDCSDPVFTGVYTQPYKVVVTNAQGCFGSYGFDVTVVPVYDIFFPNAFSPNNDGHNDFWQIFGNLAAIKQVEVSVFDRIGEKVFESNNIDFKWDGTYKGQAAPQGVYTYFGKVVWINDHTDNIFKGTITVFH